jgi:hypothetical protein
VARDVNANVVVTGPNEWFWNTTPAQPADFQSDGQIAYVTGRAPGAFFLRAIFIGVEPGVQEALYRDVTLTVSPRER